MKTALRNMLKVARRFVLRFQMRSLEAHVDGCDECLACVRDPVVCMQIKLSRSVSCRELAWVRAEYNATFELGVRRVWDLA